MEDPSPELVFLPVSVDKFGRRCRGEKAEEGFQLVPCHGVADESQVFVLDQPEERHGVEGRDLALARLPPPVEVAGVGPAVGHAILAIFDGAAARTVVARAASVGHPPPIGVITRGTSGLFNSFPCYKEYVYGQPKLQVPQQRKNLGAKEERFGIP